jgi:hypothetical protein
MRGREPCTHKQMLIPKFGSLLVADYDSEFEFCKYLERTRRDKERQERQQAAEHLLCEDGCDLVGGKFVCIDLVTPFKFVARATVTLFV